MLNTQNNKKNTAEGNNLKNLSEKHNKHKISS